MIDEARRRLLLSLGFAALTPPLASRARADSVDTANRVSVKKSERRLYLYDHDRELGSFRICLGLNPEGHKEREGDFRTPEGRYFLARRNAHSEYFLSIQISYPNLDDLRRARSRGWAPGGSVMIHGLPNAPHHSLDYYLHNDWTNGCIALSNSDMLEVWMRTSEDIPIDISA
jgi:murein L,D-transpeptidase YafK